MFESIWHAIYIEPKFFIYLNRSNKILYYFFNWTFSTLLLLAFSFFLHSYKYSNIWPVHITLILSVYFKNNAILNAFFPLFCGKVTWPNLLVFSIKIEILFLKIFHILIHCLILFELFASISFSLFLLRSKLLHELLQAKLSLLFIWLFIFR